MAVYSDGARLWQTTTEFDGDEIVLDEINGNLTAQGGRAYPLMINQINDETGLQEESITTGEADHVTYDDTLHRATYTTDARVTGPRGDLTADQILLFLLDDSRTLERIEATGNVELTTPGRSVTGESLVYYDAEGRYEMEGGPVQIIEQIGRTVPRDDRSDVDILSHRRRRLRRR